MYALGEASDQWSLNSVRGSLRLLKALDETTTDISLTLIISDGVHTTSMTLDITITTENTQTPGFVGAPFLAEVPEDTAQGEYVGRVTAVDQDSPNLAYSITSGNEDNLFSITPLSGMFSV